MPVNNVVHLAWQACLVLYVNSYHMTREEIHQEIAELLKLIEINNNRMYLNDADMAIDGEALRTNIIQLYNLYNRLSTADSQVEAKQSEFRKTEVVIEPEIQEEPKATPPPKPRFIPEEKPVTPEVKPEPEVISKPTPEPEPVVEQPMIEPEPVVEEPVAKPETAPALEPEPEPIAEETKPQPQKKKEPRPAVMPEMNDVYARLKNTKLESIKKGISISKRYEIQNELFGNDPELYNISIKTLDTRENLEDALDYLEGDLMVKHNWEEEDSLVEELKTLLVRRYM